ncbi:hypothetical protein, unlikely [Trypanosoma brucei gambiense DAL972]|uniref:T. brucei spp.-specific protein n=1 Tax=Trypanosoma brucei gambiense (strain MHOM/CI/86/DAL972) TaxID=679716 RepID=C9ZNW3_TRYB9|nr:hypothetical protein, unlikely [Trypanosoma brucei gambiense DAL972]CBH11091.1 hypothetical protein, unlikely [Trypanosoma brucei gambiense DAL972]|eukprot:XP_011773378.1 hypothetical protein, unlikely [Trypanosoma brucei gambiense DAL972]
MSLSTFFFLFFLSLSLPCSLSFVICLHFICMTTSFQHLLDIVWLFPNTHKQTNIFIYLFIYLGSTHCNPFHRHREGLLFFLFFSLSLFIYFPFCVSILFPQFIFFVSSDVSFCHFPCWLRLLSFSSFFFSSFSIILLLLRLLGWSMTSAFRV